MISKNPMNLKKIQHQRSEDARYVRIVIQLSPFQIVLQPFKLTHDSFFIFN